MHPTNHKNESYPNTFEHLIACGEGMGVHFPLYNIIDKYESYRKPCLSDTAIIY